MSTRCTIHWPPPDGVDEVATFVGSEGRYAFVKRDTADINGDKSARVPLRWVEIDKAEAKAKAKRKENP